MAYVNNYANFAPVCGIYTVVPADCATSNAGGVHMLMTNLYGASGSVSKSAHCMIAVGTSKALNIADCARTSSAKSSWKCAIRP